MSSLTARRAWRALCSLALATAAASTARAQGAPPLPPVMHEFRGVWVASVTNIDWPSKPGLSAFEQQAELIAILDRSRALNLNAVILQVRPGADALYPSKLEPWSYWLTGVEGRAPEPFWDPLAFAVREAHARGLELHAWFNPYRSRIAGSTYEHAATHVSATHPDWVRRYGKSEWMDPGDPRVLARTLAVIEDVVKRYDVDGVHIDDYFYPYPENGADGQPLDFPDGATYAAYRKKGGTLARDDWRRDNVDRLVAQIYQRTKKLKPWVQVGISPFGIWRPGTPPQIKGFDAYAKLYADARRWLHEGWADYVTPQLYWPIAQQPQAYPVLLQWWLGENRKQRHLWPGHFDTRAVNPTGAWTADEINAQVRESRAQRAGGDVHFSMRPLMPPAAPETVKVVLAPAASSPAGAAPAASPAAALAPAPTPAVPPLPPLFDRLKRDVYAEPAVPPPSPWLARGPMPAPRATLVRDPASRDLLVRLEPPAGRGVARWTVRALANGRWTTRVLPGGQGSTVVAAAGDTAERVVVTALDRVGMESAAVEAGVARSTPVARPARRKGAR